MPQDKKGSSGTRALVAWAFYDWASSAFAAIISTFVYAAYFVTSVAPNETEGAAQWGFTLGVAGLIVGICAPILGAFADQGGYHKRWMALWTLCAILSIALMWFIRPSPAYMLWGLVLMAVADVSVEFAYVFYNAMLPELASRNEIGRWSGWAWGIGYLGGVISLVLALVFFVKQSALRFHLSSSDAQDIRATFLLTAVWYFIFALPVFLMTPAEKIRERPSLRVRAFRAGNQIMESFRQMIAMGSLLRFLVARMLFTDALITLFAFGGIYAAAIYSMSKEEILLFGIAMNIAAGIGALIFAYLDDLLGSKRMIITALIALVVLGSLALLATNKTLFWSAALGVGVFVGPAQASSRAYLAKVAPPEQFRQMFGLFALSSKVTSFLGPLAVGWITYWSGNLRMGMGSIIILLMAGLMLMLKVPKD